jgi:hypothetical protein
VADLGGWGGVAEGKRRRPGPEVPDRRYGANP